MIAFVSSYGDKAPRTIAGRIFGLFWMVFGIVSMGVFTASLTSAFQASKGFTILDVRYSKVSHILNIDILKHKGGKGVIPIISGYMSNVESINYLIILIQHIIVKVLACITVLSKLGTNLCKEILDAACLIPHEGMQ